MAKSAKERMRALQARQRSDPEKREEVLQKERERRRTRKEAGKIKNITDMSKREQRQQRRKWRCAYFRHKEKTVKEEELNRVIEAGTPPNSPDMTESIPHGQSTTQKSRGRKAVRKDRSSAYRKIKKLELHLQTEIKSKEKYKKKYQRLSLKVSKCHKGRNEASKGCRLRNGIVDTLREKYSNANVKEKQIITKVLSGKVLKKYRLVSHISKILKTSHRQLDRSGDKILKFERSKYRNATTLELQTSIKLFYLRNDNSQITSGKKDTITRCKVKKQKRFLLDSMYKLHKKLNAENELFKVSLATFRRLRPFYVVTPSLNDRDTCMCKIHNNTFMIYSKLSSLKVFAENIDSLDDLCSSVCCNPKKTACALRECTNCREKSVPVNEALDQSAKIEWFQWMMKEETMTDDNRTIRKTVKEKLTGTVGTAIALLNKLIQKLCPHQLTNVHQTTQARKLKDALTESDAVIHIDFSENWLCKYSNEIQAVHFGGSHNQVTLHTGVLYTKNETLCFCTVSDCRNHGPAAVWAYLDPVLQQLLKSNPNIKHLHFQSDGPTTQYKNRSNFYFLSTIPYKNGIHRTTWNFWAASHGKGAPDGVGAVIKRKADFLVSHGHDIIDAESLFHALMNEDLAVKLYLVPASDVDKLTAPSDIPAVPKTMAIHQIVSEQFGEIKSRGLSCFCKLPEVCDCFGFSVTTLACEEEYSQTARPARAMTGLLPIEPDASPKEIKSKWCIVEYNDRLYPGIIQDSDADGVKVKTMQPIGENRFIWPSREDSIWYTYTKVLTLIDEVTQVTSRRPVFQVSPATWKNVVNACLL